MKKAKIGTFDVFAETMASLSSDGVLLVPGAETVNPMTIGWAQMGVAWGKPVFVVMVRPSRYTHELMSSAETFSVNVPPQSMRDVCMICGSTSGRDVDKMDKAGLTAQPGRTLEVPTLLECAIHYECRIIHTAEMDPERLLPSIKDTNYRSGDYHTVYWGEIAGTYKRV